MHRLTSRLAFAFALTLAFTGAACGGKKPADDPSAKNDADGKSDDGKDGKDGKDGDAAKGDGKDDGSKEAKAPKKDECVAFDTSTLEDALLKSSCEVSGTKPDGITPSDLKGKLEVTVAAVPTRFTPGGKGDLIVTFANKTKEPLTLHFRIDPTARFETEVFDAKSKRADMPTTKAPNPPKGHTQPPPNDPKVARFTISAAGYARVKVPWEAVKMKWAPEKVRGTPSEKGFPRTPAGPLAKGKYTVKVVTPLIGVSEGSDHEVSTPKVEIEVGT